MRSAWPQSFDQKTNGKAMLEAERTATTMLEACIAVATEKFGAMKTLILKRDICVSFSCEHAHARSASL